MIWKRLRSGLERLFIRRHRGRDERRTVDARSRFWSDVQEGRREAEAASVARPLVPAAKR